MANVATTGTLIGSRDLARRCRELNGRLGRQIAELRIEAGVSQVEVARRAGIAQSYQWRIEAGSANPTLEVLVAVAACLGADLGVRMFPVAGPRLRDRFQAPMVEALIRELGEAWRPQPEVPLAAARGVVDLLLDRSADELSIVCECHSELRRLELVIRRLGEKELARRSQVDGTVRVSRLLLLRSTEGTRAVAKAYEATLATAFPGRMLEALAALRGDRDWPGPTIVWAKLDGGQATILAGPPRGVRIGR
jgi:transcriptional regulator with XRE-family HTH domain